MIDFRFESPLALVVGVGVLFIFVLYRLWRHKPVIYQYALTQFLVQKKAHAWRAIPALFFIMRLSMFALLVLLIGKPQVPDKQTQTHVDGIDIILVIDASGSMMCFDDMADRRARMTIAKQEAMRFIDGRTTDAIGIVTFGNGALTACPLTHDKLILKQIIKSINVGSMVDDRATLLSVGILTALNRLKLSSSPSKVMIVLTDGQPSMHDAPIHIPISIAQQMRVKIYTIGIGNAQGGFCSGPNGMILAQGVELNEQLLTHIAQQTGGYFYRAQHANELRAIYQKIDALEKHAMPINVYQEFADVFEPFLWLVLILLTLELFISCFVWRVL